MSKPRFGVGEIALTVYNRFSENRGKIVLLKEYLGKLNWPQIKEPQSVWMIECVCQNTYLHYHYPGRRELTRTNAGPMPECFLRRITPESGQAVLELFEISKNINFDDVTV
jgi:hypothetical protein